MKRTTRTQITVTPFEFLNELQGITSSTIVTITADTVPLYRKRAADGELCPWWKNCRKIADVTGTIGSHYHRMFRSRQEQFDGPIRETGSRLWGVRRNDAPVVNYLKRLYLDLHVSAVRRVQFLTFDNEHIDGRRLWKFLVQRPEQPVTVRNYRFDRIRSVRMLGNEYLLQEAS